MSLNVENLSGYDDLRKSNTYTRFEFEKIVDQEIQLNVYAHGKRDKWIARALDGDSIYDLNANVFYVIGHDGVDGLIYRNRANVRLFRVLMFEFPLKMIPRLNRKSQEFMRVKTKKSHGKRRARSRILNIEV